MLKRRSLLLYVSGCIFRRVHSISSRCRWGDDRRSKRSFSYLPHRLKDRRFKGWPVAISSYLFQLASGSTNATPNKPSPYPNCPGGVTPDIPKPHDGGGGKKKTASGTYRGTLLACGRYRQHG